MKIYLKILFIVAVMFSVGTINSAIAKGAGEQLPTASTEGGVFLEIDTVMIPIFKSNGETGVIMMDLTAEVADDKAKEELRSNLPKVRDAFIRVIYRGVKEKAIVDSEGNLDILAVKDYLVGASNYVMKDKIVKDILLRNIAQQGF